MLCAIFDENNEVELVKEEKVQDISELMSYEELSIELCCGIGQDLPNMTMVRDGVMIWHEEECDFDFVKMEL